MGGFVSLVLEVEVVFYRMVAAALNRREDDVHVELAPAFLLDHEGGLFDHCTPMAVVSGGRGARARGEQREERGRDEP